MILPQLQMNQRIDISRYTTSNIIWPNAESYFILVTRFKSYDFSEVFIYRVDAIMLSVKLTWCIESADCIYTYGAINVYVFIWCEGFELQGMPALYGWIRYKPSLNGVLNWK